ncbi:ATP-binding protein [Pseudomonas sp. LS-2]|uniref:ATP-binding protein n=1 Tax=Pseudomonas sp. LS-2 TaxID=2315859 RepID=UPI000E744346|nr:ATP-binding protein [Pseudomonas sp. LS-2]RJX74117.1 GAF domain-containing protein [Pseudomonas sp. LS-2]
MTAGGPDMPTAGSLAHEGFEPLSIERFLHLATGAAAAVADVHASGLLHRDIKPENIVEDADGVVRLRGFELSVQTGPLGMLPVSDSICGTLAYMSPEQARRVERHADARSDLYSLGMTFYEWLAGRLPFDARDAVEWVYCQVARQPPALSLYRGDIPPALEQLVFRLIAKNPDERYQSAAILLADLHACSRQWQQYQDVCDLDLQQPQPSAHPGMPVDELPVMPDARASITIPGGQDTLDLASVMKAARALSQETQQDRLIEMLMSTTIIQAGAQRGLLLLVQNDAPVLCAIARIRDTGLGIELMERAPGKQHLPLSVLYRVMRTHQRIVVEDVSTDGYFGADEFFKARTVRSVLCLPLLKQGQLIGMLYLENSLTPGVFTDSRTGVLELLAGQAAVSLETARLQRQLFKENARRQSVETALRNARARLSQVSQATAMGELAASIAHEINQPLASMVSNAAASLRWLNRETPKIDEALSGLRDIVKDGRRAGAIVNALQSLAQQGEQHRRRLLINDVIRHVVALTQVEVEQQRVLMTTHLTRSPLQVYGSSLQLQQVVLNLILNAVDAMSPGDQVLRRLSIESQAVGADYLVISVEDSGPGIDAEHLDKVFNAFFTTKDTGMGMGLAICRSIVHAHGGQLHVMPARYGGATFVFTLPAAEHGAERNAL